MILNVFPDYHVFSSLSYLLSAKSFLIAFFVYNPEVLFIHSYNQIQQFTNTSGCCCSARPDEFMRCYLRRSVFAFCRFVSEGIEVFETCFTIPLYRRLTCMLPIITWAFHFVEYSKVLLVLIREVDLQGGCLNLFCLNL